MKIEMGKEVTMDQKTFEQFFQLFTQLENSHDSNGPQGPPGDKSEIDSAYDSVNNCLNNGSDPKTC